MLFEALQFTPNLAQSLLSPLSLSDPLLRSPDQSPPLQPDDIGVTLSFAGWPGRTLSS
ncbi:hypothetical protein AERO8C_50422 [Aeromonas veronii]|uniref:Uncharacterized protein n=1 Tax=Aeromonas veronii TaxID=654 RepID=A0A653L8B4_AERVE|nr:hypothetical protein AERO8C_50422 [Aeromonas veronii]